MYLIPCQIERSAFSTERLFTIDLPDGPETFAGYYKHFLDGNKEPLELSIPKKGEIIAGFAKCRIIQREEDGSVIIDIPSSDSLLIPPESLVKA